jgi:pyruvate ferredoxin oxidoreductase gamma subunit
MGAPVIAFCRIDDSPIRLREPIAEPDVVVVQDPTLLHHVNVFGGLSRAGWVLINSSRMPSQLGLDDLYDRLPPLHVLTVPASDIARERLGRPIPNAALLGGLVALTGAVSLTALEQAVGERFPGAPGESNIRAVRDAHRHVRAEMEAAASTAVARDG